MKTMNTKKILMTACAMIALFSATLNAQPAESNDSVRFVTLVAKCCANVQRYAEINDPLTVKDQLCNSLADVSDNDIDDNDSDDVRCQDLNPEKMDLAISAYVQSAKDSVASLAGLSEIFNQEYSKALITSRTNTVSGEEFDVSMGMIVALGSAEIWITHADEIASGSIDALMNAVLAQFNS